MDETSIRAQLELAVSAEPPIGHLVGNSLRAGRRLRRRRQAAGAASLSAAAVVVVGVVPALTAGADHPASRSHPAAAGHPAVAGHSAVAGQAPESGTAYVATNPTDPTSGTVVPISLATNTAGTPIKVPDPIGDPFITSAAVSPNGRTVYEVGSDAGNGTPVTPIDTATNTAGPAINVGDAGGSPQDFVLAPDGKTAYLTGSEGLFRIGTATNTASKLTKCTPYGCGAMALTPDGKTLYVIDQVALNAPRTVTVIQTASNTVLTTITLPVPRGPNHLFKIAITPNGKTAYVLDESYNGQPGASSVVPINVATNTPLAPVKLQTPGEVDGIVIAPDGQTAYVLSSLDVRPYEAAVIPIDTATNQAEPAINLLASANPAKWDGESYNRMALTPDGKTLYVLTPQGVIPIRTASDTVLPTIRVPGLCSEGTEMAITPDGRTIYVGACITGTVTQRGHKLPVTAGGGVVPISTATNTAGQFINLGQQPVSVTFAR
jgi:hypothetical protein